MANGLRWRPEPETAAAGTGCALVVLVAVLFFVTAFLRTPIYEWGPTDEAAYNVSFGALGCCLLAFVAIVMAAKGRWPHALYPLAAAALVQAAVLCVLASQAWAALPLLLLAAANPWWSVSRPRLGVETGLVAVAMLLVSVSAYRSIAEAVGHSLPPLLCQDAAPAIVARLEASVVVSGVNLRSAQVVRSRIDPSLWFVAANVEGGGYGGAFDTAVWLFEDTGASDPGALDAADPAYANNNLASEISDLEYNGANEEAYVAALNCARDF